MLLLLLSFATKEKKDKFNALYSQYKELVKYIALDIVKNDKDAEEVVQETFLRLFLKMQDIGDIKAFRTHGLVLIISRRVSYNKLKYEKRRKHEPEARIHNIKISGETTEEVAISKMEHERIFGELQKLNQEDFELITLRHYYGYSYQELEVFFDMSSDALRKRYQRFRNKIISKSAYLQGEMHEQKR